MDNQSIGDVLRRIRKRKQMTLQQVADLAGTDTGNLSRVERGTQGFTEKLLSQVTHALGVTISYVYTEAEGGNTTKVEAPTTRVPLVSWVTAGAFSEVIDMSEPGIADEWVETSAPVRAHTFALRVRGDSMEPEFSEGTIIIVEPDIAPQPGDFIVARNGDGEATFKQLAQDGSDLYLKPLNPRYPIKPLVDGTIIGVVREALKRYR